MCDEANTEAVFLITNLLLAGTTFDAIMAKYPMTDERFRFYRMYVGYQLKAYFAYRRLSTLDYLKKKGIPTTQVKLEDNYVPQNDNEALVKLLLEEVAKTEMEKKVLEFYLMGNSYEVIGEKVGLMPKRVRRVVNRIKRRLRRDNVSTSG